MATGNLATSTQYGLNDKLMHVYLTATYYRSYQTQLYRYGYTGVTCTENIGSTVT